MKYHYFASFQYPTGMGNAEVILNNPINSWSDIENVEAKMKEQSGVRYLLLNYQLLRVEP